MTPFGRRSKGAPPVVAGGASFDEAETPIAREAEAAGDTGGVATLAVDPIPETLGEPAMAVGVKPSRFGRFGRGGGGDAAPAPERAPKVAKAAKPERVPKAPKASKAAKAGRVEPETSLPVTVVIDFFMGVTKEREAEILARAQIEKNFNAPNASYLYVQRWRDGLAVEMQEGGGRAYLPEVLAKLDEDPSAIVALAMSNKFAQVRLDPDTKSLETLLLTSNTEPPEDAFIALPTKSMMPFDRRGSRVFLSGIGLLAASTIALVFSVGAFFIDTKAWSIPFVQQTPVKDLPMAQSSKIDEVLRGGADCIYKMEYMGSAWTLTPGYDNGDGTCAKQRAAGAAVQPAIGPESSMPPVAGAPGSVPSMAAGAPAGVARPVGAPASAGAPAMAGVPSMPVGARPASAGPMPSAPGTPSAAMAPGAMAPSAVPGGSARVPGAPATPGSPSIFGGPAGAPKR